MVSTGDFSTEHALSTGVEEVCLPSVRSADSRDVESVTVFGKSFVGTQTVTVSVARPLETIREAILALLDAREFLAYQLSHANGAMTDEQLEEIADEYLKSVPYADEDLAQKVLVLRALIDDRLDAEVTATAFNCTVEQASRVLAQVQTAFKLSGQPRTRLIGGTHG